MRVNQLASEIGVTGDTVRYYTRIGFLKPTKNPCNGYKEYSPKDRRLLRFILSARQLGFSVNDVGEILHTAEQGVSAGQTAYPAATGGEREKLSGQRTVTAAHAQRRRNMESKA